MIYVCDFEFKEGSIEDAYKMLTSDDFLYNTAVILDTTGGIMSKFVTTSLYYYLSSSNQDRTDALTQIFCRLTDFAFDKLPANSPYKTIQHALKKHLVVQEVAA